MNLTERFNRDVGRPADDAAHRLVGRWNEPHRQYHDEAHLVTVLDGVDQLAAQADDPGAVRLAAWYHDAVYEGRPGDDEEASALLAEQELTSLGWEPDRVSEVGRLIRATADHAGITPGDRNAAVLADADLAILASSPMIYRSYAEAVRREYAAVPDDAFAAGRAYVLTRLLESDPLYRTPEAAARWTDAARANLRAEIAELRG